MDSLLKLAVLRPGDLISIGRCVLLYGSRQEIYSHCHELHRKSLERECLPLASSGEESVALQVSETGNLFDEHGQPALPFPGGRPPLPRMNSLQSRGELSDLLAYFHSQLLRVLEARNPEPALEEPSESSLLPSAQIPWPLWYLLIDLESDLAQYLKEVPEPE